jgi:glycosyltransferase involved in cell wall biosynthesis
MDASMEKLTIVYIMNRFPPVYSGVAIVEIIKNKELVRRGHKVFFITPKYDRKHPDFELYEGINVIRVQPPLRGPISEIFYVLATFIKIIQMKIRPDVIVDTIPFGNPMPFIRLFTKIRRIPVVARLSQSGANEPLDAMNGAFGFMRKRFLSTYDKSIAISPDLYEICKRARIPDNRIELIPDCVDTDLFSPVDVNKKFAIREQLFPGIKGAIVTVVGNVSKRKRPHLAIETWKILKSKYSEPATLVFVGPVKSTGHQFDEEYVDQLKKRIQQYNLDDSVLFTGFQKNIQEYYQASDITLFVSEREGLPGAVLQTMSAEIPIVTVNIEKITEYMLSDGKEGYITSDDPHEISGRMITLLSNLEIQKLMGKNGRINVLGRFSIKEIADQTEKLFQIVIANKVA